jgi:hypothetical protein
MAIGNMVNAPKPNATQIAREAASSKTPAGTLADRNRHHRGQKAGRADHRRVLNLLREITKFAIFGDENRVAIAENPDHHGPDSPDDPQHQRRIPHDYSFISKA